MGSLRRLLVGAVGAVSLGGAGAVGVSAHEGGQLIQFDSMTPVTGSAVGTVNDRGIKGGGLPWVITSGHGHVDRDGRLSVTVKGLIIVVPPVNGKNPVAHFSATVSCVTPSGIVNVTTGLFPPTLPPHSNTQPRVALPSRCSDP